MIETLRLLSAIKIVRDAGLSQSVYASFNKIVPDAAIANLEDMPTGSSATHYEAFGKIVIDAASAILADMPHC